MRREYIEEHQIAERYLQGRLSETEEAEFEQYFLGDAQMVEELELVEKLRQGLQDVATVETLHKKALPETRSASFFRTPRYAAAATVLLLVSMTISTILYQRVDQLSDGGLAMSYRSTRIIPVLATRGAPSDEPVTRFSPEEGEEIVLLVDPGPNDYSHYRTTVYRQDAGEGEDPVWQSDRVLPGYQDMLALAIPGSVLEIGDYRIRVDGWRDERPAEQEYEYVTELQFRIVPRE